MKLSFRSVVLVGIACAAFVFLFIGAFSLSSLRAQLQDQFEKESDLKTRIISSLLRSSLMASDYTEIQKTVESLRLSEQIGYVEVQNIFGDVIANFKSSEGLSGDSYVEKNVEIVEEFSQFVLGRLKIGYTIRYLEDMFAKQLAIIGVSFTTIFLFFFLLVTYFVKIFVGFSRDFKSQLNNWDRNRPAEMKVANRIVELDELSEFFKLLVESFEKFRKFEVEALSLAATASLASQIAHDIRSPLIALNMVVSNLKDLPEEKRLIVRSAAQRINDISNQLLKRSKVTCVSELGPSEEKGVSKPVMLTALIDSVVSEKRMQFRDRREIEIIAHLDGGFGLFVNINQTELARVLSNLINNSVEAISGKGSVALFLESRQSTILIRICDDGKGIPNEILNQLGKRGVTYGKNQSECGSGLGVYHARKTVEEADGRFIVESETGRGTKITLSLPKADPPKWFAENIRLTPDSTVVSVDDDQSIHQIWKDRVNISNSRGGAGLHYRSFTTTDSFENWVKYVSSDDIFFLMDYEFLGQKENGLDVIVKTGIAQRTILVTSRFDEISVQEKADSLGVKVLPKGLAPYIPLNFDRVSSEM